MRRIAFRVAAAATLMAVTGVVASVSAASSDPTPPATTTTQMFAIGDGSNVPNAPVEWWGSQWANVNLVNAGEAPDAFKGWTDTVTLTGGCSGTFTADTGNASGPPQSVSGQIEVLVVNSAVQTGSDVQGTFNDIVYVNTDPGFAPNPGHEGTGIDAGSICGSVG